MSTSTGFLRDGSMAIQSHWFLGPVPHMLKSSTNTGYQRCAIAGVIRSSDSPNCQNVSPVNSGTTLPFAIHTDILLVGKAQRASHGSSYIIQHDRHINSTRLRMKPKLTQFRLFGVLNGLSTPRIYMHDSVIWNIQHLYQDFLGALCGIVRAERRVCTCIIPSPVLVIEACCKKDRVIAVWAFVCRLRSEPAYQSVLACD
ncbi:hypothetical protein EDD15DRAFT_1025182 [Pisolithus albus]|nr:hypothetical protein EDD15DRAFT_1025182 [Pisolithus albus]